MRCLLWRDERDLELQEGVGSIFDLQSLAQSRPLPYRARKWAKIRSGPEYDGKEAATRGDKALQRT